MSSALTLRTICNLDELRELGDAWHDLLAEYPYSSTFLTPEWLISWWQCFARSAELLVLAAFDSQSRLIGLAPLSISLEHHGLLRSFRVLRLMGDGTGDSDGLDLPVRYGFEKQFLFSVLAYLKQKRRDWDICQFNTMPADSPTAKLLIETDRQEGLCIFEYRRESSIVRLPDAWDKYLQELSSEDSKNLERYTRRLNKKYTTRIYRARQEDLPKCLEALFRLHQLRWTRAGQPGSFSSKERRQFYRLLSNRLLERDTLEFWILELDGEIVAAQFGFRFKDRVFQLQEGYDPQRPSDRVGFVLRGEVLKQLIGNGVTVYDFLGGVDTYKARWGAKVGHYQNLHFARRLSRGGAYLSLVDFASRTKNHLRSRMPAGAWKALQKAKSSAKDSPAV